MLQARGRRDAPLRGRGRRDGPGSVPGNVAYKAGTRHRPEGQKTLSMRLFSRLTRSGQAQRAVSCPGVNTERPSRGRSGPRGGGCAPSCPSQVQGQSRAARAHAPPRSRAAPSPGPPGRVPAEWGCSAGPPCSSPRAPSAPRRASLLRLAPPLPARRRGLGLFNLFLKIFFVSSFTLKWSLPLLVLMCHQLKNQITQFLRILSKRRGCQARPSRPMLLFWDPESLGLSPVFHQQKMHFANINSM